MINILTASLLSFFIHAHHISVCQLNYKQETQTIEMTQQVFADDLEMFLKQETENPAFDIRSGTSEVESAVRSFAEAHIQCSLFGQPVQLDWIAYRVVGNDVKFYIELKNLAPGKLVINHTIFHDMLGGQENVIHFSGVNGQVTGVCTQEKPSVVFQL